MSLLTNRQVIALIILSGIVWNSLQGLFQLTFHTYPRNYQYIIYSLLFIGSLMFLYQRHELPHLFS